MKTIKMFNFYGNCIIIHGFSNSLLYDLDRGNYYIIPAYTAKIVESRILGSSSAFLENHNSGVDVIILEWLNKFSELGLGIIIDDPKSFRFPKISLAWDAPCSISNSIIFYDVISFNNIHDALCKINCQDIQIHFFEKRPTQNELMNISDILLKSSIKTCEIVSVFSKDLNFEFLERSVYKNKRFRRFFFSSALRNEYYQCCTAVVLNSTQKVFNSCGFIQHDYFTVNIPLFTESQHHNTCLNRKLCIDKDGYIKNCPYMEQHYGHISNTKIEDVVALPEFQKWWHIKKDDIDVCKDCEFRHMCTDCRAFIKDPENIYSQPAKCTYNPYICKWEGEEGYVPVEECGTYSRETGFVPDKKKIKKLNKQIWGDE